MNFEDRFLCMCRSCLVLTEQGHHLHHEIPNLNLSAADILATFGIAVDNNENYSDVICTACLTSITFTYNFLERFKANQEVLIKQDNSDNKSEYYITVINVENDLQHQDGAPLQPPANIRRTRKKNPENEPKHLQYECPICVKSFKHYPNFTKHIVTHGQHIWCPPCSQNFLPAPYLEHYNKEHRYFCRMCSKSLSGPHAYHQHMKLHDVTTANFVCSVEGCGKAFVVKSSLKNHMQLHDASCVYLCNLCGAHLKNYDSWRYHMKKHMGGTHLCPHCGKAFVQAAHLSYHMWRHTGIRPHKCADCGKRCVTKRLLKAHLTRGCPGGKSEMAGDCEGVDL